ncbi:uncharacterized protein C8R40DRAFT_1174439 [Lentinula edodes]|uniref:uncharacterized protein n=1 Tax=Lentinula edodes TaxID=5353 RepID=UPI001E8DC144|nr:uncharacterized protein C8R40DRAFT_1174439 [Lentinula edodes]KAH7871652.1 hypothetical protein C8R40DRAFT_1174439 [Lentinula edodes]
MSSSHDQNVNLTADPPVLLPDCDGWYRSMDAESVAIEADQLRTDFSKEARRVYIENEMKDSSSNELMDGGYELEDSDDTATQSMRIIPSSSTLHSGPTNVFQRSEDPAVETVISHEPTQSPGVFELQPSSYQKLDESVAIAGTTIHSKDASGDDIAIDIAETQRHFITNSAFPVLDIPVSPSSNEGDQGENRRKFEDDELDNSTSPLPLSDALASVMRASKEVCNPTDNDTDQCRRKEDEFGPGLKLFHALRDLILLDLDLPKILFTAGCIGYLLFLVRALWKIGIMFHDQPLGRYQTQSSLLVLSYVLPFCGGYSA